MKRSAALSVTRLAPVRSLIVTCPPMTRDARRPTGATAPANRLNTILLHSTRYCFEPQCRLATDVHCSRSTISRLVNGRTAPSFALVQAIASALEEDFGFPIDAREIFSPDGTYPTRSACRLCQCDGCLPEQAYTRSGSLKPEWRGVKPGNWTLAPACPSADAA